MNFRHHAFAAIGLVAVGACAAALGPAAAQDRSARGDSAPLPASLVVLEFSSAQNEESGTGDGSSANGQSRGNNARPGDSARSKVSVAGVLEQADAPQLSRLVLRDQPDAPATVEGALIFADIAALAEWRDRRMQDFFEPMGGPDAMQTTIRVVNRDLMARYGLGSADMPLEEVSITYANEGNDAGGDADIDAITVICPGDFSDCDPSN
ncbi:hypothetical protein [Parvularcula oceani]|uniref:hypothetical protein n=1 Tax=Parvularcula oceani TaxID=1247963 RepID=UPI0012DD0DA7|nr:hypothetical protein [Parvularcula oceani]